jgi:hypothetical protein
MAGSLRIVACLMAVAGSAQVARAQELVTLHWSFTEVIANTTVAATGPLAGNGVIDPGEGAQIRLTVSFSPPVGTLSTYTPPPGSGIGTVGGLASVFFDLRAGSGHDGTFHNMRRRPGWSFGPIGTIVPDGADSAQVGMFPLPGQSADPANPIENIWWLHWTPNQYSPRIIEVTASRAAAASGTGAALYVEYSGNPLDPAYIAKQVAADFGSVMIPVVPAPSTLVLLAGAAALGTRRRR